jgi:hypothetical protein
MDGFFSDVFSGVFGTLIVAGLAVSLDMLRTQYLISRLTEGFSRFRFTFNQAGWGVTLENITSISVVVREVAFLTTTPIRVTLNYHGPDRNRIGWDRTEDDTPLLLSYGASSSEADSDRGFILLPAYSAATWIISHSALPNMPFTFNGCILLLEYPSMFGGRRLKIITTDNRMFPFVNEHINTARLASRGAT